MSMGPKTTMVSSALCIFGMLAIGCGSVVPPDQPDAGPPAPVQGTVTAADGNGTPVNGAKVRILGTSPPITTLTDANGVFSFSVPTAEHFIVADADAQWGALKRIRVPSGGLFDVMLETRTDDQFNMIVGLLGRTLDTGKGVVWVQFAGAQGGESATMTGANSDRPFTIDPNGPVESEVLVGGSRALIFTNVDISTVSLSVTGGDVTSSCALEFPGVGWPTIAKTVTYVIAVCN